jgi:hypothetical protein
MLYLAELIGIMHEGKKKVFLKHIVIYLSVPVWVHQDNNAPAATIYSDKELR